MNKVVIDKIVGPLIKKGIFESVENAVQKLMEDYVSRQIVSHQQVIKKMERKHGMNFTNFTEYLKERAKSLQESKDLSSEQKLSLGRRIMNDEDDWLDWKAAHEMLESWVGLEKEVSHK